jgi:trans-2,3-dihydro-3-hydroxyanthranilate isomerase
VTRAYLHFDVFTSDPLAGNQLAVFLDGRGLEPDRMQAIAREMAFSETTFILPAEQAGTDVRMRIFTPGRELPMAGHPTIGSTFALAYAGVIAPRRSRFVFGLGVGPTPVDLEWRDDTLRFAWMTQRTPAFGPRVTNREAVAAAVGLAVDDLHAELPVQEVSCGAPFLMIPLRDRAAVDAAVSDAAAIRRLDSEEADLPLGLFLFAISPAGSAETIYSRMFGANVGIAEDAATGSASGPVGAYLVHHRVVRGDTAQRGGSVQRIVSLQGVAMKRPSWIHIAISGTPEAITLVKVGGEAVLVAEGELLV